MKVLIATVGTRGDVQPYLALAVGLKSAGHQVAICTCPRFESFVSEHGIAYSHLDDGLLELLESDLGRAIFEDLNGLFGVMRAIPKVLKKVGPIHKRMVADCWAAAETHNPDTIVYHPKMICVPAFAARRKIPAVLAMLCPFHVPTGEAPLFGPSLGKTYNRLTYRFVHLMSRWGSRSSLSDWRTKHDEGGLSKHSGPTQISRGNPIPVIHAYSPTVCPRPIDWPERASVSGYWFLPTESSNTEPWSPSKELVEFLDSGPPPIYIGFGSIAGSDPTKTTQIVLSAIKKANVRAVIATGWGGLESIDQTPSVHVLESAPHEWLFPKMAAVVHHGGAGTTAAGLRFACPTIVCPFGLDQPFWGRRVFELGAGVTPIPMKKLTAERLTDAIRVTVSDQGMRASVAKIAASMANEEGVLNAVKTMEKIKLSYGKGTKT